MPESPDENIIWVFTNDGGATAPYWFQKNVTEISTPAQLEFSTWADGPTSALTSRSLPSYINFYYDAYCTPNTFVGQVANPSSGNCYGQGPGKTSGYSLFFPSGTGVKEYVNVYRDDNCKKYITQIWNFSGGCFQPHAWFRSIFPCSFC